ncbi:hypothetical protein VPH35_039148 [Triticum aestivum]|uniref:Uncharacterized protein n=1 Tax=Aegilops tauschii TaxID=37682 RepID=R7W712_AEGTA|nr:uncharacterized protein LOC120973670 [Aegilops tauschii subsp. strangulata]
MPVLSSPLAPMRLVTFFFLALFLGSCEARRLLVHGSTASSSEPPPAPRKADGSPTNQPNDLSTADAKDACVDHFDAKVKSGVAASSGSARTAVVGRVSRRLSHRDLQVVGTAFHLDYAGPETHLPTHN